MCYLAVQAHPAAVQSVLTEPGGSTQVIFPCGGIDHLEALVSNRPVHTEVGSFPWLASLCVTYSCGTGTTLQVEVEQSCFNCSLVIQLKEYMREKSEFPDFPTELQTSLIFP